jgi:hypothetical protein
MNRSIFFAAILFASVSAEAQSGGTYEITQSAVSNGGGSSAGGTYDISGTVGQPILGNSSGSGRRVRGGFWQSDLAPTAAAVSISGRVYASGSMGLSNASVVLTLANGSMRTARSSSFGYFRFDDIEAGQTVFIQITSKTRLFDPQVLDVSQDVADLEFFPLP